MTTTRPTARQVTAFDEAYQGPDRPQATEAASIPEHDFEAAYGAATPPWDIPGPQPAFVALAEAGLVTGRVLDIGCGTGENALFLAEQGLTVVGVDVSPTAIAKAQGKATDRGLRAEFVVGDALRLTDLDLDQSFDTVIDSGLLHVFSDGDRERLVSGVHAVLDTGGRYLLLCFSEHAAIPGPRRLTQDDIRRTFGTGWRVESIVASRYAINPDPDGTWRSEDAGTWLARIRKVL